MLKTIFGDDLLSKFCWFKQIKVSLFQEETTEIESIDFIGCCTTQLKDGI